MTSVGDDLTPEALSLNRAFYEAFQSMDLESMTSVWTGTPQDTCIHPGWEIYRGWEAIRESWRAIFAGTGYMRFEVTDEVVTSHQGVLQLTCIENIYAISGSVTHHSRVACTNLYVQTAQGWRMTLHHGSPIASVRSPSEPRADPTMN